MNTSFFLLSLFLLISIHTVSASSEESAAAGGGDKYAVYVLPQAPTAWKQGNILTNPFQNAASPQVIEQAGKMKEAYHLKPNHQLESPLAATGAKGGPLTTQGTTTAFV